MGGRESYYSCGHCHHIGGETEREVDGPAGGQVGTSSK